MKLGTKIIIVAVIPLITFMIVSAFLINEQWEVYKGSQRTLSSVSLLEETNNLNKVIQLERGLTVSFNSLNAGMNEEKDEAKKAEALKRVNQIKERLNALRTEQVEMERSKFLAKVQEIDLDEYYANSINEAFTKLDNIRVDQLKKNRAEVFSAYTDIISSFMALYKYSSRIAKQPNILSKIKTIYILENAKESAAQLRGTLVNILTLNTALEEAEFNQLLGLKATIDANLNSPVLELDEESVTLLKEFPNQPHWKKTADMFQVVLRNADFGLYNEDPAGVNESATKMLNDIISVASKEFEDLKSDLNAYISNAEKILSIISLINIIVVVALVLYTIMAIRSITKPLNKVIEDLLGFADDVTGAVKDLGDSAKVLSDSAETTTRAVQQVGASTDEITAMLKNTFESSTQALANVEQSQENSRVGAGVIQQLSDAMVDIQNSNEELKELENVILEIGAKTSVINDIVFETRLLSFNASIEAARAGQHGKGFAVVAEEVGNLAKMSGDAADTITNLIKQSTEKVNQTISNTSAKINQSQEISNKCSEVFHQISESINELSTQVNTITTAAKEQELGIQEVGRAMKEVDEITLKNTSTAQETSGIADQLKGRAEDLTDCVSDLESMAYGKKD